MWKFSVPAPAELKPGQSLGHRFLLELGEDGVPVLSIEETGSNADSICYDALRQVGWGDTKIKLRRVFGFLPFDCDGYLHSELGLQALMPAPNLFPGLLKSNAIVPLLLVYNSQGEWKWRLCHSRFDQMDRNLLAEALQQVSGQLSALHPGIGFSSPAQVRAQLVPVYESAVARWFRSDDQSVDIPLRNAWLSLQIGASVLRLRVDLLKSEFSGGKCRLSFWELPSGTSSDGDPDYPSKLLLRDNQFQAVQLQWPLAASWVRPPDVSGQMQDMESEHGPWLKMADGMVRAQAFAAPGQRAGPESRRWTLPLPGAEADPPVVRASCLLDQSGRKVLRLRFDEHGKLQIAELLIDSPVLDVQLDRVQVLANATLAHPDYAPPVQHEAWQSLRLLAYASTDAHPQLHLGADETSGTVKLKLPNSQLWCRPKAALVAPSSWAANDSSAREGLSALRGLVPFDGDITLSLAANADSAGIENPRFPPLAHGAVLLALGQDQPEPVPTAEIHIVDDGRAQLRHRHANPHLDTQFEQARVDHELVEHASGPRYAKVKDAYHSGLPMALSAAEVLNGELIVSSAAEPAAGVYQHNWPSMQDATGLLRTVQLGAGNERLRCSVAAQGRLHELLEAHGLRLWPLQLIDKRLRFSLHAKAPTAALPAVLRGREASMSAGEAPDLSGSVALSSVWLQARLRLLPSEGARWLGVESDELALRDEEGQLELRLTNLSYWFELQGVVFPVKTTDTLVLGMSDDQAQVRLTGKNGQQPGCLHGMDDGEPIPLHRDHDIEGEDEREVHFVKDSVIAPALTLSEHLLGGQARLQLYCDGHPLVDLQLTTYGNEARNSNSNVAYALLQAGAYHLAWAGNVVIRDWKPLSGCGIGLGALSRVFLRLERSADGSRLLASGLLGWHCHALPGGWRNSDAAPARVTFYARQPGQWSAARFSGRWSSPDGRAIILWRHAVSTRWDGQQPMALGIDVDDRWLIVQGVSRRNDAAATRMSWFAYQRLDEWQEESILLSGEIALASLAGKESPASTRVLARPAIALQLADPQALRWNLKQRVDVDSRKVEAWVVPAGTDERSIWVDGLLPPNAIDAHGDSNWEQLSATVSAVPVVALTRTRTGGWLLCAVVEQAPLLLHENRQDKLWIFTESEEMIELPGFREGGVESANDSEATVARAEDLLSLMRWRQPAVLERWGASNTVNWTLVDAPLLNIFNPLRHFTTPPGLGRAKSTQVDRALVNGGNVQSVAGNGKLELLIDNEAKRLNARIEPAGDSGPGMLSVRRAIPFDVLNAERAFVGTPWPEWSETREADAQTFLTATRWSLAAPRPGELQSVLIETCSGGLDERKVSALSLAEGRAPRVLNAQTAPQAGADHERLYWSLPAGIPSQVPLSSPASIVTVLAGSPDGRDLSSGERWPVVWMRSRAAFEAEAGVVGIVFKSSTGAAVEVEFHEGSRSARLTPEAGNWLRLPTEPGCGRLDLVVRSDAEVQVEFQWSHAEGGEPSSESEWAVAPPQGSVPEACTLPSPSKVMGGLESGHAVRPRPHLIGVVSTRGLLGYGPWLATMDLQLDDMEGDPSFQARWCATGTWSLPAQLDHQQLALVCIAPNGSVVRVPASALG